MKCGVCVCVLACDLCLCARESLCLCVPICLKEEERGRSGGGGRGCIDVLECPRCAHSLRSPRSAAFVGTVQLGAAVGRNIAPPLVGIPFVGYLWRMAWTVRACRGFLMGRKGSHDTAGGRCNPTQDLLRGTGGLCQGGGDALDERVRASGPRGPPWKRLT